MGVGKLRHRIEIIQRLPYADPEGFNTGGTVKVWEGRAALEVKHASAWWAQLTNIAEVDAIFKIRKPTEVVRPHMEIIYLPANPSQPPERYRITAVEDVAGRGRYLEIMGKKVTTGG